MLDVTAKRLARAEQRVAQLEALIEDATRELYLKAEALQVSRDGLERLFDAMPGPVLVLDEALSVTRFNRAALQLLGVLPLALHHLPAAQFFPDVAKCVAALPGSPGLVQREAEWLADGPVPVLVTASRYADADARGFVLIATDLRDRRALEVELRHAQKLEAIGALSAGVAHELNTPLQFISDNVAFVTEALTLFDVMARRLEQDHPDAFTALAEDPAFDELPFFRERVPRSVDKVVHGLARVRDIVRALKDFSHPGGPKAPVRLDEVVKRAVTVARSELKGLEVQVDLAQVPEVMAHESDLNQVLLNLLVNAAHATHDAGRSEGVVQVRATVSDAEVVLQVVDHGCGIPPHVAPRVFEPFFTTKEVGRGSGQGLPICRKLIVERHQGRLWFDTVPGLGTTFSVALPRHPPS